MVTLRYAAGSDVFHCGRVMCGRIVNTRKNLRRSVTKFRAEIRAVFRYCWNIKYRDTISVQFFRGHSISQSHYKVTKTPACNICAVLSIKNVSAFLPRHAECEAASPLRDCDLPEAFIADTRSVYYVRDKHKQLLILYYIMLSNSKK